MNETITEPYAEALDCAAEIMGDLNDRQGIKHELRQCADDTIDEIKLEHALIITRAMHAREARLIDALGCLVTTDHESKEAFIQRVRRALADHSPQQSKEATQ